MQIDIEKAKKILKKRRKLKLKRLAKEKIRQLKYLKLYKFNRDEKDKSESDNQSSVQTKNRVESEPRIISRWPSNWRIKGYPPGQNETSSESENVEDAAEHKFRKQIRQFKKNYTRKVTPPTKEKMNENITSHAKSTLPELKPLTFVKFWKQKKHNILLSMQAKALNKIEQCNKNIISEFGNLKPSLAIDPKMFDIGTLNINEVAKELKQSVPLPSDIPSTSDGLSKVNFGKIKIGRNTSVPIMKSKFNSVQLKSESSNRSIARPVKQTFKYLRSTNKMVKGLS